MSLSPCKRASDHLQSRYEFAGHLVTHNAHRQKVLRLEPLLLLRVENIVFKPVYTTTANHLEEGVSPI